MKMPPAMTWKEVFIVTVIWDSVAVALKETVQM
jgi:hypothetical protein